MQPGSARWHFSDSEVRRFFKTAPRVFSNQSIDLLALPSHHEYARLLVVTPKRIASAPRRNRIRRQIKELFRTTSEYDRLPFDLLCIVKKPMLLLPFTQIADLMRRAIAVAQARYAHNGLAARRPNKRSR